MGSGEVFTVLNDGKTGIGTITPRAPLEIIVNGNNTTVQTALVLQQTNPGAPNNSAGVSLDFGIGNTGTNNNIEAKISVRETFFAQNPKMVFTLWDVNNVFQDRMTIFHTGVVNIFTLAGSGTSTVTADASGNLGRTTALSYDISNNILLNNDLYFTNGVNIFTGLVTGTMFGTSDLQKLSFYGQIPVRQPDTGVTPLTKLTFGGSPVGELDTFGGYTIGQVVAALQQLGLLQ
jgi:hypothetical protein